MGLRLHRSPLPRPLLVALVVVSAAYLATVPGPLRTDTDAGLYLQLAASVADGTGLHPPGSQTLPPGYPMLLGGLDAVGLLSGTTIALLLLAFLVVGLLGAWVVCRLELGLSERETTVALLVTALSVYVVKYASVPTSELPFFAIALASLGALALARHRGSLAWLVAGVILAAAACTVRSAGIALFAAALLAPSSRRVRRVAVPLFAAAGVLAVVTAPYALQLNRWTDHPLATSRHEFKHFVITLGSVAANAPTSHAEGRVRDLVLGAVGVAMSAVIVWCVVSRRRRLRPGDAFALATLAILIPYPSEASRFYLPVLPIFAGYAILAARRLRRVGWVALATFSTVGSIALGYSVVLAYSGDAFPERYAGGTRAATYRVAWGAGLPGDEQNAKPRELAALRRYDPDPPIGWSGGP